MSTADGTPQRDPARLWESRVGTDLSFLLARANALSLAAAHDALAPHGLKVRQFSVLAIVADGLRPTQRELAEFLRLDPSQVVTLVDQLQSRDLLRREPDPTDRRNNVVVATPAGISLHDAARADVTLAEQALFGVVDPRQLRDLRMTLHSLAGPATA
ncbi:MAG: MarR family transcriptional regulator [Microbacterium sp.]|uniref:MarR family winged helix-turn-helix transcriptional regulator n=1 Tax=Microbacterium sp. TaxID=51671 RepID=UPI0039E3EDFA